MLGTRSSFLDAPEAMLRRRAATVETAAAPRLRTDLIDDARMNEVHRRVPRRGD